MKRGSRPIDLEAYSNENLDEDAYFFEHDD
jgi:hypothetical protein